MAYTTIDDPTAYFQVKLYTGNNSTNAQTLDSDTNMQPDMIWFKRRDSAAFPSLIDDVRGVTKRLAPSETDAEGTVSDALSSFDSDGFTLGDDDDNYINFNTATYVAWCWKANGSGSSNTDGNVTTTVSANTTAGFSIVKWTSTSDTPQSLGHGLGVAPKLIICKDLSATSGWVTGAKVLGWDKYLTLDSNSATTTDDRMFSPSGGSDPTSTLFYQTHAAIGSAGEGMIAFCLAEKKGYSKFSSFVGNGSNDGVFCWCGFKPAMIIYKKSGGTENWFIHDNKRQGYNPENELLFPDLSNAEATVNRIDLLSNGFKARTSDGGINADGSTYIYMAFAEAPFVNSNGVPATAV